MSYSISKLIASVDDPIGGNSTLNLGDIKGVGPFGFENEAVSQSTTQTQLSTILSTVITTITVVGSLAFVIYFTLGGLKWLTAGGDKNKVQEAQTQMTQGALGLIVITISIFVVGLVGGILGIDILNPFKTLFGNL